MADDGGSRSEFCLSAAGGAEAVDAEGLDGAVGAWGPVAGGRAAATR
jgi:hypothetical protein